MNQLGAENMDRIKLSRPTPEQVDQMGVFSWGTWGCEVSAFDWEYDAAETCYVLEGEVVVKTDDQQVHIKPGDLARIIHEGSTAAPLSRLRGSFRHFGARHTYKYASAPKWFQLRLSLGTSTPRYEPS
jgi:hypothetical protein